MNKTILGCLLLVTTLNCRARPESERKEEQAKIEAIVACETGLRSKYRLAINVTSWNVVYSTQGNTATVVGEDEVNGQLVRFRCVFEDFRLTEAIAR